MDREGNVGDLRLRREVLALVLVEHPVRLTLAEVQRGITDSFEIERAVAALVADGLIVLEGENLLPTSAALRFNELEPIRPPGNSR